MTNTNFQNFLKTLADSGKVEWVQGQKINLFGETFFSFSEPKNPEISQSFFLKLASTLVPEGENPEVQKLHEESENLYEDGHDFFGDGYQSGLRAGKAEASPKTHRLAIKTQIITAFELKPLEEAVDECINILSKFL